MLINLGENHFAGVVPTKMPESMQGMILRCNQFTGNIPPQNKLSGFIPPCLFNITSMDGARRMSHYQFSVDLFLKGSEMEHRGTWLFGSLDLSTNNLSGEISTEIFGFTQFVSLNLCRNRIMGIISSNIGGMKNLEILDLSYNNLSGEVPEAH